MPPLAFLAVLVALAASGARAFGPSADAMTLHKVSDTHCQDGSPAAYYYRPSKNASSTLWVISLDGGGGCTTEQTCKSRVKNPSKSSSKDLKATTEPRFDWLSSDPQVNPDFHDAHMVDVYYCSSDSHLGMRTEASDATWGFYFSGHSNLVAIVRELNTSTAPNAFKKAERVLLTGQSAGGIGTLHNADWLASAMPESVVVKAAPLAGWFNGGNYPDQVAAGNAWAGPSRYPDFAAGKTTDHNAQISGIVALWNTYASPACLAAQSPGEAYHCWTAHVAYRFTKTPMFMMQNMYDPAQMNPAGLPRTWASDPTGQRWVSYFGAGMRNSTTDLKAGDGIFLASCLAHGDGLGVGGLHGFATTIQGLTSGKVLGDWFWERTGATTTLRDTCDASHNNLPCNPSCPNGNVPPGPTPPAPPTPPGPTPPAPPTPPGPSPPLPAGCQQQLQKDGCLAAGSQSACYSCIHTHREDLLAACGTGSMHDVRAQCPSTRT